MTARVGLSLFTAGMLLSEAVLFLQGLLFWVGYGMIPGYYGIILGVSVLIPAGVVTLLVHGVQRVKLNKLQS
jgi:hypothetical protein